MKFRARLLLNGKTATGIAVPAKVVDSLGKGQRPPVTVRIGSHTYRSTVAAYNGVYMLPVSAEHRDAAGIAAGQTVEVDLQLDTAPREVSVPLDFAKALAKDRKAQAFFDGLSYSNKSRHTIAIEGAKTSETRQRRIEKAIADLHAGKK